MTFVLTENCIRCKVHGLRGGALRGPLLRGRDMLVIYLDGRIDCEVYDLECPAEPIFPGTTPSLKDWLKLIAECAATWPSITIKHDVPRGTREPFQRMVI